MKPRLLDLFCCAGGAAKGYADAGFDVVGVDIKPQPNYPYAFILGDAIDVLTRMLQGEKFLASDGNWYGIDDFTAIHASPPCQFYSVTYSLPNVGEYPDLVAPVRGLLLAAGKPYVIENVEGAPLDNPLVLCGSMFGLKVIRHRLFECRPPIWFPPASCQCKGMYTASHRGFSSYSNGATAITVAGNNYRLVEGLDAMGIDWMKNKDELSEAIPPAYTEYIGKQLINVLQVTP